MVGYTSTEEHMENEAKVRVQEWEDYEAPADAPKPCKVGDPDCTACE